MARLTHISATALAQRLRTFIAKVTAFIPGPPPYLPSTFEATVSLASPDRTAHPLIERTTNQFIERTVEPV